MGRNAVHRDSRQPGERRHDNRGVEVRRPAVTATAARLALATAILFGFAAVPAAHDPLPARVTFAREIGAILSTHCIVCHSRGGPAPMPLTVYAEVRPWARAIKESALARRMPTWHAARGFGAFANDPTLTPFELSLIVSWVDGGTPEGGAQGARDAQGARSARGAQGAVTVVVPARGEQAMAQKGARWVTGWSFAPGDPLITNATISSDAGVIGTWVAGDGELAFPRASALRMSGRVRVDVRRRTATDYERPFTPKRSVFRLTVTKRPTRRVWVEHVSCGAFRTGRSADLIAIRPVLPEGGSAKLWIERPGATKTVLAWFRNFDPRFPRTYWLTRPADFPIDARLQSDAPCELDVTLVARR